MTGLYERVDVSAKVEEVECSECAAVLPLDGLDPLSVCLCANCDTPFNVPMQIGQYLLESKVSDDGVITEFVTFDQLLNRHVTLKKLNKTFYSGTTPNFPFLQSSGVVNIYSSTVHRDELYLVLEHIKGTSLEAFLSERTLPVEKAVVIALTICDILKEVSEEDIHHGNLTLSNIWIDGSGNIKLTDFMLRQNILMSSPQISPQRISKILDIPYCSANRLTSLQVDEKSDVYSLGVCLYKMLTGRLPFKSTDVEGLTAEISLNEPDIDSLIDAEIDPWLIKTIMSILAGSAAFETLESVSEHIQEHLKPHQKPLEKGKTRTKPKPKSSSKSKRKRAQVKLPSKAKVTNLKSKRNLRKLFK